ncbi:MAG TPA: TonB family protein [bacterium (Candidatus Stahlbacteria)]|nr:TonB family protein [Candidatus Stahlbacteria bacterium]
MMTRSYLYSSIIHILILILASTLRVSFERRRIPPLQIAVGRPPAGLPSIPRPGGLAPGPEPMPIPIRVKQAIKPVHAIGPILDLPSPKIGWGSKQFATSFGDIDIPGGKGSGRPWFIEGVASGRKVIKEVIPEYPPGYEKEARIKLAFTVAPGGAVKNIIVVKKGDPFLERIAIDAFSRWRFEPISDSVDQDGEITFIFKLK